MTRFQKRLTLLALPVILVAAMANAQTTEIEIGYRWLDLSGSEEMYRSQVNERQGLLLRALIYSAPQTQFADRFNVTASDLGNSPSGMLRLEAAREGSYLLRVGYRTADVYSAIPNFANPLLSQGIVPGQHTFDRTRTFFDADLEFIPGRRFSPFVGVSYGTTDGPGRTTYFAGQDEFRLASDLNDTEQEIRAGANFTVGRFIGQVTQGWREFKGREDFSLDAGEASGNNTVPILGRNVTISSFTRDSRTDVSTPFTNAFIAGDVTSRIRLVGSFVHLTAETDGLENESLSGSFVSFPISRFFGGLEETVGSRAKNTTWRGDARAEIAIADGVDLVAGYRRENRELDGAAAINSLFIDTITFGGAASGNLEEIHATENAIERSDDTLSATVTARNLGAFSLRAGYSETNQDVTIIPDLAEVVIVGNNSGTFERKVRAIDAFGAWTKAGFSVSAMYKHEDADTPIFRTDFTDRGRARVRASYGRKSFRIGAMAEQIDYVNDVTEFGIDGTIRQYSADVSVSPVQSLEVRASASRFDTDSVIGFRRPETFGMEQSVYAEEGTSYEGGIRFFKSAFSFDLSGSRFDNVGTTPFSVDRYRARVVYDFMARAGLAAEYSRDEYREERFTMGDYDASRIGLFLRFRR
jgi:hypothetical protein